MKAFDFRLDHALRWRELQATLQKARFATAAAARVSAEAQVESQRKQIRAEHNCVRESGLSTGTYVAYRARAQRALTEMEKQVLVARNIEAEAMIRLREVDRKARLLSRLRATQLAAWQKEFDRETDAFAGEAYLSRLQARIEKQRARSSGG